MAASTDVVVVGAGGHALVCFEVLSESSYRIAGCISDDGAASADIRALGVGILGRLDELHRLVASGHRHWFVAVGDNAARRKLSEAVVAAGGELVSAVSARAAVSPNATIGAGALVMPGATINALARIAPGAIVNTAASIDHECEIGSNAHVAPGVAMAGRVVVGEGALVGIGARVTPGRSIGAWATVGAGAVVIDDVADGATVAGVPARRLDRVPDRVALADAGSESRAEFDEATNQPPRDPHVLVVCTGNLCRSPLVQALLRRELEAAGIEATVSSAGLTAPAGQRCDGKIRRVAAELGVAADIDAHRSHQITPEHVRDADLILAMTGDHVDELERLGADPGRVVTLRSAAWRARVIGRSEIDYDEWVSRLTADYSEAERAGRGSTDDIADPIGGRLRQYRAMAIEVSDLVDTLVDHWGAR